MRKPPQEIRQAFKFGPVSVTPRPNGTWLFYWREGGIRNRVSGPSCSMNQAQALASNVAQAVLNHRTGLGGADPVALIHAAAGREYVDPNAPAVLSVRDALVDAIRLGSQGSQTTKRGLTGDANLFLQWLAARPKPPQAWEHVTRAHVMEYLAGLDAAGLAGNRIANRFKPIRLAARHWAANDPERFRDVTANLRLPAGKPKSDPAPLSAPQAVAFLARVEAIQPALAPVYALALSGGLRILEAASVRLRDVDLTNGTVTVADVPWHSVKTHASKRTVPVPVYGLEFVRRYLDGLDTLPVPDGPLFTNQDGRPWVKDALGCAWKRLQPHLAGLDLPERFTPSECRSTFATLARRAGCDSRLVECCMGHAGRTVLARHYEGVGLSDLRHVADAVQRVLKSACLSHVCPTVPPMEASSL